MDPLRVSYRVRASDAEIGARAEALALEQTVEVPRVAVRDLFIEEQILGRVETVVPDTDGSHRVTIAIPAVATALDPAQILNLIFGNSSLHEDITCIDIEFPESIAKALRGPRFGVEGLRRIAGVHGRPLTCTALKPMGQSAESLADLFRTFAGAGIDVIKDDHGLCEHAFCPFEERVRACLAAEREVAAATGHRALYVPNLIGTPKVVFAQLAFAEACGARAVMVSPMLIGMPVFWELCHDRATIPVLAHPSFAGSQRIAPDVLFGKLFRAYGADAVIFVNFESRFGASRESCRRLSDNLVAPWAGLLPSLPVPGGGIDIESAGCTAEFYGRDSMLLVGGNLQLEADSIAERSRAFVAAVRASG